MQGSRREVGDDGQGNESIKMGALKVRYVFTCSLLDLILLLFNRTCIYQLFSWIILL